MPNKLQVKQQSALDKIKSLGNGFNSRYILDKANDELQKMEEESEIKKNSYLFKALTLNEFDNGMLMCCSLTPQHAGFAINYSKNLQTEYNCQTESEKSLAEIIALNLARVLFLQDKISAYFRLETITNTGVGYLNFLSKEMDRAQRHYLSSLNALRSLRMPPLEVNIRTNTAVVGNNQVIQNKVN